MDPEAAETSSFHRLCFELTREAIVNWVIDSSEPTPDDDSVAS